MPTKSASQQRLMLAAAHTKGGYGGVPQSVGRDFVAADQAAGKLGGRKRLVRAMSMDKDGKDHGRDSG